MQKRNSNYRISYLPYAIANIKGSESYTSIRGKVKFYPWKEGSYIKVELIGLPNKNKNNFFGFHIHEESKCTDIQDKVDFESAGGHLNTENDKHPQHIGDLPMIYSNLGYAYMEFVTNRFKPSDVVSCTIVVHEQNDDLITEPAGNSGNRIACGEIKRFR